MNAQIIFSSLVIFLVMTFFGFLTENYVSGGFILDKRERDKKPHLIKSWKETANLYGPHNIVRIIVPAILVAAVSCFTAMSSWWLNVIFAITIFGVYVIYAKGFFVALSRWREIFVLLPLLIAPLIVLLTVTKNIMAVVKNSFWASVICPFIPWAIFTIVVLGAFVFFFRRRAKDFENKGEHESAKRERAFSVIVAVLLVLALLLEGFFLIAWPKSNGGDQPTPVGWPYFYNLDLQNDGNEGNDLNFGPDPYKKGLTAADYDEELRARIRKDPALGAADIAWLDANVGTRFLGEFYESCKGNWAKTINAAKVAWIDDQNSYNRTLNAFFSFLDDYAEVSVVDGGKQITDQMYMNPYTVDGIPDVIVLMTKQQEGPFLVYTITIKGNTFKVEYRIPCGYQPTNVKIVMGITPQAQKPSKSTSSGNSSNGGGKGGGGSVPTTKPDEPTSKYNKDPSKSNNSGKNDDSGPGADTNSGGNNSTKDKSTNSNHMSSYDKYREEMRKLSEANTTTAPSSYSGNRDSNEGEASKPTPTKPKPTEITTDPPAQQWNGPSD